MHPILFHLHTPFGPVPVYAFGTMLGLAILLGWYTVRSNARRFDVDVESAGNAYALCVFLALIAGRLSFLLVDPAMVRAPASWLAPTRGGLLGVGAVLGAGLGLWLIARRHGIPLLRMLDVATPSMALGLGLVRVGCYLYGCDYGLRLGRDAPSLLATLGTFPRWHEASVGHGPPVYLRQLGDPRHGLSLDATHAFPVHPTQLYEALLGFVLLALSAWLVRRARRPGDVFLPVAVAYGAGRLLIEPLRGDPERGVHGMWTAPGVFAAVAMLGAAALLLLRVVQDRRERMTPTPT